MALAIASAILAADGQLPAEPLDSALLFAELGLDGSVRPVRGAVVAAVAGRHSGRKRIVVARRSVLQAAVVPGVEAVGVASLRHWGALLSGQDTTAFDGPDESGPHPDAPSAGWASAPAASVDLRDVRGQSLAVGALQVAAVGGHHVAMIGRPGVGKTLLAERLPTILPDLTDDEALEVTAIASVVGEVDRLVRRPPFQAPHHTATVAALVGGGRAGHPYPGSATLAHAGVLFLDEAAEFAAPCLDALRQPLESGSVTIARAGFTARMPARFQLVLAANPCPCGLGDGSGAACTCRSEDRRRYLARLSGPVLDRVDIRLALGQPRADAWGRDDSGERDSQSLLAEVVTARERGAGRARALGLSVRINREYAGGQLRSRLAPSPAAVDLLTDAVRAGRLSARGADRVLRVAWSVADLIGVRRPGVAEVGRALALRGTGVAGV